MNQNLEEKAERCVKEAVGGGEFGPGEELIDFDFEQDDRDTNVQFASTLLFFNVRLKRAGTVRLVMKSQPDDPAHRSFMNTAMQFHNEVYFFQQVAPFLDTEGILRNSVFPKLFYGKATGGVKPEEDAVILADLGQSGVRKTRLPLYYDYEHCALALSRLGLFHAHSYRAKAEDPVAFYSRLDGLKPTFWDESSIESFAYLPTCIRRGVLPLIRAGRQTHTLEAFLRLADNPVELMRSILIPEPATAVVCHGDFCGNNMLFRYAPDGDLVDVRFVDLQHAKYASPAIDIAFFLFLNTDIETKNRDWDRLLRVYYDSLSTAFPGTPVPSFDTFYEEFSRKAVYAYVILSYFLPVMLEEMPFDLPAFLAMSEDEKAKLMSECGGDRTTALLSQLVTFMLDKKYI